MQVKGHIYRVCKKGNPYMRALNVRELQPLAKFARKNFQILFLYIENPPINILKACKDNEIFIA
jgi:hypothetical protein